MKYLIYKRIGRWSNLCAGFLHLWTFWSPNGTVVGMWHAWECPFENMEDNKGKWLWLLTCKAVGGRCLLSLNINSVGRIFFVNIRRGEKEMCG